MVNIESGERYYIINAKSETVVDLSGADDRSGALVQLPCALPMLTAL